MLVRDGMNQTVVTVGPGHSLREAARRMTRANVGSTVVLDPDGMGPGIFTERDLLRACGAGKDLDLEVVSRPHDAAAGVRGCRLVARARRRRDGGAHFRHVIVLEGSEVVGILSMRDIVRCWTQPGATAALAATSGRA